MFIYFSKKLYLNSILRIRHPHHVTIINNKDVMQGFYFKLRLDILMIERHLHPRNHHLLAMLSVKYTLYQFMSRVYTVSNLFAISLSTCWKYVNIALFCNSPDKVFDSWSQVSLSFDISKCCDLDVFCDFTWISHLLVRGINESSIDVENNEQLVLWEFESLRVRSLLCLLLWLVKIFENASKQCTKR